MFNLGVIGAASNVTSTSWANWTGASDGSIANINTDLAERVTTVPLNATQFLAIYAYYDGASNKIFKAVVGTISGTSIAYGTAVAIVGTPTGSEFSSACFVSSGVVFVSYITNGGSSLNGVILSISGTTVTINTPVTISSTAAGQLNAQSVCALSSTAIFAAYNDSSTSKVRGVVVSLSGTTLTVNTNSIIGGTDTSHATIAFLSSTQILLLSAIDASHPVHASIVNISGTSIGTIGTQVNVETNNWDNSGFSGCISVVTSSEAVVVYGATVSATDTLRAVVLSLSGNTVTANTAVSIGTDSSSIIPMSAQNLNANDNMVIYAKISTNVISGVILTLSGTTISVKTPVSLETNVAQAGLPRLISQLDANNVIYATSNNSTSHPQAVVLVRN